MARAKQGVAGEGGAGGGVLLSSGWDQADSAPQAPLSVAGLFW